MADSKGVKLVKRRHPIYSNMHGKWEFFKDSYNGGEDYNNAHLFQYFKEGNEEFGERKKRAYRENHSRRVVDLVNSYIFKEEVKRKSTNKLVTGFLENYDGKGKTANQFMKGASQWASVMGRVYVVMDKKALPEDEQTGTQKDNINPNAQPYCYIVYPQDVLDIAFDDNGKVKWALIKESKRDDDDPFESSGNVKDVFRLWMPGQWLLFNEKGEQTDQGETGLSIVPIAMLDNEEKDAYSGSSLIGDIAYLDRAIFNNWSRLDVIVNDQTFSQLIFPIEGLPSDIVEDEELRKKFLTLATNRILLYSAMAQVAPAFISPDASQADFILKMIERQVKQLYSSMGLKSEIGEEITAESGVAKAYDFDKLNKLLAGKADNCEQCENDLVEIFGHWVGAKNVDCEIDYPDEFDVKTLADEIALAQELTLLDISKTFEKEVKKAVALKTLPKLDEKTMRVILDEIDARIEDEDEAAKRGNFDFDEDKEDRDKAA